MSQNTNYSSLNCLLEAPSKSVVCKLFNLCFSTRSGSVQIAIYAIKSLLEIDNDRATKLHSAICDCINVSLSSEDNTETLNNFFDTNGGDKVDARLRKLLTEILIAENLKWKEAGMVGPSSVYFPQCSGIEWEIEKKVEGPLAIVSFMTTEDNLTSKNGEKVNKAINIKMKKESLEIMLKNFRDIKEGLS